MLVVATVSAARLAAARPWQRGSLVIDTDVAHLLMAIAMAGMLASSLRTLPDTAWAVIFGLMTAWFAARVIVDARANGVRALAGGHCAPHLVHSGSMLYMFLAVAAPAAGMRGMAGMSGMSGGSASAMMTLNYPTLAFLFVLVLLGYSIWDIDQLSGKRYSFGTARVSLAGAGALRVPAMAVDELRTAASPSVPSADAAHGASHQAEAADRQALSRGGGADGRDARGAGGFLLSPGVTVGSRIAMGVVMAFILIVAL
jgi:hypothetical protein